MSGNDDDAKMVPSINLNIENNLYEPAKKRAQERGIVFEEYLWRLVNTDLSKGRFISEKKVREVLDEFDIDNFKCSQCDESGCSEQEKHNIELKEKIKKEFELK